MKISIVIPFYNEEENVEPVTKEVLAATQQLDETEIILVDDGSTDETWNRIKEFQNTNTVIKGIRTPENRGQSAALFRGMQEISGDIIVTLDGDLQNNPADIPKMIERMHATGSDVVCGYRFNRKDTWSKRIGSRIANRVRNWITHDHIRDTGCSLKIFKKECIVDLPPLAGFHRFMPAYFKLSGRVVEEIPVDHRARAHGTSKYTNLKRLPRTVFDLLGFCWYRKRFIREMKDIPEMVKK